MEIIADYAQQYPLVLAGAIVVLLFLCWKSEEVRTWVVRMVIFLLVLSACYFVFQKYKYKLRSSSQPPAISDDSGTPEDHAGKKYYRDPAERMKDKM